MEKIDKGRLMTRMDVSGWMFLLVLSHPGSPGHKKVKVAHTRLPSVGVLELIPFLGSQPAGDVNQKPDGWLPLHSVRPAVTPATLKRAATNFAACLVNRGMMGVNSLPKTVTRRRRDCDLNPGPSAPKSSTLISQLPSHPFWP